MEEEASGGPHAALRLLGTTPWGGGWSTGQSCGEEMRRVIWSTINFESGCGVDKKNNHMYNRHPLPIKYLYCHGNHPVSLIEGKQSVYFPIFFFLWILYQMHMGTTYRSKRKIAQLVLWTYLGEGPATFLRQTNRRDTGFGSGSFVSASKAPVWRSHRPHKSTTTMTWWSC